MEQIKLEWKVYPGKKTQAFIWWNTHHCFKICFPITSVDSKLTQLATTGADLSVQLVTPTSQVPQTIIPLGNERKEETHTTHSQIISKPSATQICTWNRQTLDILECHPAYPCYACFWPVRLLMQASPCVPKGSGFENLIGVLFAVNAHAVLNI